MNDLVLSIMLVKEFMFQTFKRHRINIVQFLSYISNMNSKYYVKKSQEGIQLFKNNDHFCNI